MKIVFLSSIRSSLLINNYDNENKNTISINCFVHNGNDCRG